MKESRLFLLARSFIIVVASVTIVSIGIDALAPGNGSGTKYTVLASVQPARYLVVDSNLQIKQVISNTRQDVVPYVMMNSLDGNQLPYTDAVRSQFLALKPSLNFSKAGVVYARNTSNTFLGAAKNVLRDISTFIFG
jgi:hypothetical protein